MWHKKYSLSVCISFRTGPIWTLSQTVRVLPHPHCSLEKNCFSISEHFFSHVSPHFFSAHILFHLVFPASAEGRFFNPRYFLFVWEGWDSGLQSIRWSLRVNKHKTDEVQMEFQYWSGAMEAHAGLMVIRKIHSLYSSFFMVTLVV